MAVSERLGSGFVGVNFDKISTISLTNQDRTLRAEVLFKVGNSISVVMDKAVGCYVNLPHGGVKLTQEDIKSAATHGAVTKTGAKGE